MARSVRTILLFSACFGCGLPVQQPVSDSAATQRRAFEAATVHASSAVISAVEIANDTRHELVSASSPSSLTATHAGISAETVHDHQYLIDPTTLLPRGR